MDVAWKSSPLLMIAIILAALLAAASAQAPSAQEVESAQALDAEEEARLAREWTECLEDVPSCIRGRALPLLDSAVDAGTSELIPGLTLERVSAQGAEEMSAEDEPSTGRSATGDALSEVATRVRRFLKTHSLKVQLPRLMEGLKQEARAIGFPTDRTLPGFGRNSFLTGFGLGFLAFGLKKLLLPFFIGAQIVKSVLLAMFLPSILGGIGKLLGKGVSTLGAASAGASSHGGAIDDFDFKDNGGGGYEDAHGALSPYAAASNTASAATLQASGSSNVGQVAAFPQNRVETLTAKEPLYVTTANGASVLQRFPAFTSTGAGLYFPAAVTAQGSRLPTGSGGNKFKFAAVTAPGTYGHKFSYATKNNKNEIQGASDFKVFHNIPSSALLLTTYDPFYSPLLSRVDSVFKQLGRQTESCRERLVCDMYRNPAKFAPFSNLVSAQLSRELNELKKPQVDNPEILRFFRYMKAAKVGQDNHEECSKAYAGCDPATLGDGGRGTAASQPPMLTTYNDINRLVEARNLARGLLGPDVEQWLEQAAGALGRWFGWAA
ncbi:uncharacterized protein LOC124154693 [Ischnura elegans]|uniref:uncharacterized protein LOC124154693 n=1 Tax=Ischnura elegans TaxID=197161 RepID=UPI001ED86734|nr:uncharacterized protein LOC124154693 [Ischnura elegans]